MEPGATFTSILAGSRGVKGEIGLEPIRKIFGPKTDALARLSIALNGNGQVSVQEYNSHTSDNQDPHVRRDGNR